MGQLRLEQAAVLLTGYNHKVVASAYASRPSKTQSGHY